MHPLGGLGDKAAHVYAAVGTGVGHPMTVDPAAADGGQFAVATPLCPRNNGSCRLHLLATNSAQDEYLRSSQTTAPEEDMP
jgi:hypothetical protein